MIRRFQNLAKLQYMRHEIISAFRRNLTLIIPEIANREKEGRGTPAPAFRLNATLQADALERRNDVVRNSGIDHPAIETRTQIPVASLQVLVFVKPPRTTHHDD